MDTLLVIDMQKALFSTPRFDATAVAGRINKVAESVRSRGGRVIHIRHNGSHEDGLIPHSDGWQLIDEVIVNERDLFINKTTCDAFCNTNLQETLAGLGTERLIVTGCATDFCVDATIRAAASRNHTLVVVEDGHTTADRPHLKAEQVIAHHNWVWRNLITPEHPVEVLPASALLSQKG